MKQMAKDRGLMQTNYLGISHKSKISRRYVEKKKRNSLSEFTPVYILYIEEKISQILVIFTFSYKPGLQTGLEV